MGFRYEVYAIVVTDTQLFGRTGDVGRWARRVEAKFTATAKAEAPDGRVSGLIHKSAWTKRHQGNHPAGSMKRKISGDVVRVGPRHLQTTIKVDVPYALFVIRGTPARIYAKSARIPAGQPGGGRFTKGGMFIPGNRGFSANRRQWVRGQAPNNFLGRAFDITAISHSSLRGHSMVG